MNEQQTYASVQAYYGQQLQQTSDLKTSACCTTTPPHPLIASILRQLPSEVVHKYYGCGTPLPLGIQGLHVLDLGSGSGRDCYVAAALVGPEGFVTGIDMTDEQVDVANRHIDAFMEKVAHPKRNLRFLKGFIENLEMIPDASVDLVISNCVINLSPHKSQVLQEVYRVLKPGGEFFFSDVYASRRLSEALQKHEILYNECLSGALYVEDFKALSRSVGFQQPRIHTKRAIQIHHPELEQLVGLIDFFSVTFRCFKVLDGREAMVREHEEDYGHVVTYLGTIPGHPVVYVLDTTYTFETHRPVRVGGDTAAILRRSWLHKYFEVHGDWATHFGLFEPMKPTALTPTTSCCM